IALSPLTASVPPGRTFVRLLALSLARTDFQDAVVVFLLQGLAVDGARQQNLLRVAALAVRLDGQDGVALLDCDLVLASARQLRGDHDFAALVEHVDHRLVDPVPDYALPGGVGVAGRLRARRALAPPPASDAATHLRPGPHPPRRQRVLA